MDTARRSRRTVAAILAALGLVGLGLAAAAQLEIAPTTLQAGDEVVATCQPADEPIRVEPVVQATSSGYRVTGVRVSGISTACNGLQFKARLLRENGTTIGSEYGGTLTLPAQPFIVPVPNVPASEWGGISATIYG